MIEAWEIPEIEDSDRFDKARVALWNLRLQELQDAFETPTAQPWKALITGIAYGFALGFIAALLIL